MYLLSSKTVWQIYPIPRTRLKGYTQDMHREEKEEKFSYDNWVILEHNTAALEACSKAVTKDIRILVIQWGTQTETRHLLLSQTERHLIH